MAFKWFKKESGVIDFTDRGKNVPKIETGYGVTKEGFIEFKDKNIQTTINANHSSSNSNIISGFDFLNNMAMSSLSNNSDAVDNASNVDNSEVSKSLRHMSTRIEDNSNELYRLLHRIELLERKIERLEGRTGNISE